MKPRYSPGPDYYVSSTTGALLRREAGTDEAFYGGHWHPTNTIGEYMIGEENNVDEVTEESARVAYPAAFT